VTLAHALLLTVETFGGAVLMLGAFWTVVTVADLLRLEPTPPYGAEAGAGAGSPLPKGEDSYRSSSAA
jgi:hypothetical protein